MNLRVNNQIQKYEDFREELQQQYEEFLGMFFANRMLVFPVPVSNPEMLLRSLSYVNRKSPRNKSVTGRGILRYFVSLWGPDVNPNLVSRVADELWATAALHEK